MKRKIFLIPVLVLCFTFMMSSVCFAEAVIFTKALVDSNSYTPIAIAKKYQYTDTASVIVSEIYTADGLTPAYNQVYLKAMPEGKEKLVEKMHSYNLEIPAVYRNAGSDVMLYGMGHLSWLDCRVTGRWDVH